MKRTMMIAASLLVAACGGPKSDIKTERSAVQRVMLVTDSSTMQQQAYMASMKTDLGNLSTAEEMYFTNHGKYTANLEAILAMKGDDGGPVLDRFPTPDNSTPSITLVGGGWTATIQNPNTRQVCAIFVGTKTPIPPATEEGVPACR